MDKPKLYLGTSGIVLPYRNQAAYPPELEDKSRLSVYATLFNTVEVNSIFYKLPRPTTIRQWSLSVGNTFRFTFKLWKEITHCKGLVFNSEALQRYFDAIEGAEDKAGCILVQFPPSVKFTMLEKVAALLSAMQEANPGQWPVAIEFRSPTWYRPETYDMLNNYGAAMVIHDKKGSQAPHEELLSGTVYLRFHGPGGNYRGSYDESFLYEYAGYISDWLESEKKVFVYFNNTMGDALANLKTLRKMLSGGRL